VDFLCAVVVEPLDDVLELRARTIESSQKSMRWPVMSSRMGMSFIRATKSRVF